MALSLALLLLLCPVVLSKPLSLWYYIPTTENNSLVEPMQETWAYAQSWCQNHGMTLYTLDLIPAQTLTAQTQSLDMVWMGLQRNQTNDSAWSWIDTRLVQPSAGDVSQSLFWSAAKGSGHCAFFSNKGTWYSRPCDEPYGFFCTSAKDEIKHYKEALPWSKAREACQSSGQEIFTILDKADEDAINKVTDDGKVQGWIGLYRVGGDKWQWAGGEALTSTYWALGEPVTRDCGAWSVEDQLWTSFSCDSALQMICHKDALHIVTELKTWEEALEHCAGLGLQLLVVQNNRNHHDYVRRRIHQKTTEQVWIGLRFLAGHWWWLDNSEVTQALPWCPEPTQTCGVISSSSSLRDAVQTADCSQKLNFVCYDPAQPQVTVETTDQV